MEIKCRFRWSLFLTILLCYKGWEWYMRDLIIQYKETLCKLENAKISAKEEEIKILTSMISDVTYALEWMKNAKMPGNRRE